MSSIKISRESGYADRVRDYKVVCNSETIGTISNGETKVFEIPEGQHELYLKIDWCSSNKVNFELNKEDQIKISGGSSLKGMKIFLAVVYILFKKDEYLWLRVEK